MAKLIIKDQGSNTYNIAALISSTEPKSAYDQIVEAGYDGTAEDFSKKLKQIVRYPIGSIYISTEAISPGNRFGGTWQLIEDGFILGANNYNLNQTGGEKTHKLTINEIPSHNHGYEYTYYGSNAGGAWRVQRVGTNGGWWLSTKPEGGDQPHNNMPPFKTVYIYERIA